MRILFFFVLGLCGSVAFSSQQTPEENIPCEVALPEAASVAELTSALKNAVGQTDFQTNRWHVSFSSDEVLFQFVENFILKSQLLSELGSNFGDLVLAQTISRLAEIVASLEPSIPMHQPFESTRQGTAVRLLKAIAKDMFDRMKSETLWIASDEEGRGAIAILTLNASIRGFVGAYMELHGHRPNWYLGALGSSKNDSIMGAFGAHGTSFLREDPVFLGLRRFEGEIREKDTLPRAVLQIQMLPPHPIVVLNPTLTEAPLTEIPDHWTYQGPYRLRQYNGFHVDVVFSETTLARLSREQKRTLYQRNLHALALANPEDPVAKGLLQKMREHLGELQRDVVFISQLSRKAMGVFLAQEFAATSHKITDAEASEKAQAWLAIADMTPYALFILPKPFAAVFSGKEFEATAASMNALILSSLLNNYKRFAAYDSFWRELPQAMKEKIWRTLLEDARLNYERLTTILRSADERMSETIGQSLSNVSYIEMARLEGYLADKNFAALLGSDNKRFAKKLIKFVKDRNRA